MVYSPMWRGLERCLGQHEKEKQLLLSTEACDMNPGGLFFCDAWLPASASQRVECMAEGSDEASKVPDERENNLCM